MVRNLVFSTRFSCRHLRNVFNIRAPRADTPIPRHADTMLLLVAALPRCVLLRLFRFSGMLNRLDERLNRVD
jgi:hypothetical protein